ncbi:pitrilysin family protein [Magnetovibrio sp. PR-2]|uniref:M16 family metallopeptidase n=1 Tax=Magnetovibrio sp. PR-2 TaxID=3120356 RepID=UPI002FCE2AF9
MRTFIVSLFLSAVLLVASHARAEGVFNPHTFTLKNGMEVVVLPNHRAPVVLHMVWYKVGSAEEPAGKSGIAHVLEHLMFKGTPKHPDGEFSTRIAEYGGQENAFTSLDYTGYYQTVASDQLDMVMELEADRMTNLVLSEEDVRTELAVVLEERNSRIETKPAARLREQSNQKLYPKDHPYGRPIIGWRDELEQLTREDALAFYKDYYAPDNAILVVAGDVTVERVKALAEQHYGPKKPSGLAPRQSLLIDAKIEGGETVLADPRVKQASWSDNIIQPSLTNGHATRVAALEILSEILGGGGTSRLYRALVIEQPLAVSVGTYYDSGQRGDGRFVFYASPLPGVELDDLKTAVYAEADKLLAAGLGQDELARVKKRMQAEAVFSRDSLKTGAWAIGGALAQGHTIEDVEKWPDRISAVTAKDVLDALKAVMDEPKRTTAKLLPQQGASQ